jgi:hypothetical protein
MFAKTLKFAAIAALTAATVAPAMAEARPYYYGNDGGYYQEVRGDYGYRGDRGYQGDRGYRGGRGYRGDGGYYRGGGRGGYYAGGNYRGRCRDKGTGGTIIGAIAGGLLGNEVGQGRYNRGDGTTGAILGAGVGALAGRAIDRNC